MLTTTIWEQDPAGPALRQIGDEPLEAGVLIAQLPVRGSLTSPSCHTSFPEVHGVFIDAQLAAELDGRRAGFELPQGRGDLLRV